MKTKKPKKPLSQAKWRKKCVELAKILAKTRDQYRCKIPGCYNCKKNGKQIHGSHIFPESMFHELSIDVDNIEALCATHHMNWHEHPIEAVRCLRERNLKLYEKLLKKSKITLGLDYEVEYKKLKERVNRLVN
jgi:hypothetical protein